MSSLPGAFIALILLAGCAKQTPPPPVIAPARVDEARLAEADAEPHNWYNVHRGSASDHFSPLNKIDQTNVGELGFAWQYETNTTRGLEATPIVVDGVMYTSGNWGKVYAVDAKTGRQLWTFDPQVPGKWGRRPCCDVVNRGVAVWKGKVYVASLDARLFALDSVTGKVVWQQDTLIDRDRYQTSTGAPQIAGGKVVIGNSGAELGVRGYFSAYDAHTGDFAWRFFTVPGDPKKPFEHPEMEMASKTWDPDSAWDIGGGGTVWGHMAYDPKLNLLYVGVGNGAPHPVYIRSPKGGDNLFLSSILAINPDTGRLAWHYQTTPGDSWDYTAIEQLVLTQLQINGRPRQVVMQAPKNGFFYVLDRTTGELLSAGKYGRVNWASHIDLKTGKPVLNEQSDYSKEPKLIYPGQAGAHNWRPMSFSPKTGLVYIPVIEMAMVYSLLSTSKQRRYRPGESHEYSQILSVDGSGASERQLGTAEIPVRELDFLKAYDPVSQQEVWSVATSTPGEQSGGVLATGGGLVFQGDGAGFLNVYAADTGASLARINVGTGIMAAPLSYAVDGEQYVAVMAGVGGPANWMFPKSSAAYRYGNAGRVVAFKLGGGKVPLRPQIDRTQLFDLPQVQASAETVARGEELYGKARCNWCHAHGSPGVLPDLLNLSPAMHQAFKDVVLKGILESRGMASFADVLSEEDVEAIHAYLVDEARKSRTGERARGALAEP
jgi:quinohemoprotein ethanol dehydrogenase